MSKSKQQRAGSVVWNGTLIEQLDLMAAVQHNCECTFDRMDGVLIRCSGHAMLARDQRALDGLLWNRHIVRQRLTEEGICTR